MDKRAGLVGEIPLERGGISPSGMKMFSYKHSEWAGPVAEVKPIFIIFDVSQRSFLYFWTLYD